MAPPSATNSRTAGSDRPGRAATCACVAAPAQSIDGLNGPQHRKGQTEAHTRLGRALASERERGGLWCAPRIHSSARGAAPLKLWCLPNRENKTQFSGPQAGPFGSPLFAWPAQTGPAGVWPTARAGRLYNPKARTFFPCLAKTA